MWISRARSPLIVTAPTPSTDSSARFTCLSAISVSVRRLALVLEIMMLMIGSASGSCFWTTGGSVSGGTARIAPATFSRTALAASSRSASSTNRIGMLAVPPALTLRRHLIDAGDAAEGVLHRHDDRRRHLVGRGARQPQRHVDLGGIGLREEIDAEVAEREQAEHDQRHHQHRREHRPADAEL